jgi:hypothetical protein
VSPTSVRAKPVETPFFSKGQPFGKLRANG